MRPSEKSVAGVGTVSVNVDIGPGFSSQDAGGVIMTAVMSLASSGYGSALVLYRLRFHSACSDLGALNSVHSVNEEQAKEGRGRSGGGPRRNSEGRGRGTEEGQAICVG